jgi:putative ABC transport system permease protein
MRLRDVFPIAWSSLTRTKGRSVLTMLGITIGVLSVILMLSIGRAAEHYLLSQVASFGSDMIFISNGKGSDTGGGGPSPIVPKSLTQRDYDRLRTQSWVKTIDPTAIQTDLITNGAQSSFITVSGAGPESAELFSAEVGEGRFISEDDMNQSARVVVLGIHVARTYFGDAASAVGQRLKIGKQSYRVIGVMAPGGTRFFSNTDDQVYVPSTTVLQQYNQTKLDFISLKTTFANLEDAKEQIRLILRDTHNLDNSEGDLAKDNFIVSTQEDAAKNAATIGSILQILLGAVAAISLIVGGIGIMNIMYVTVTERTREIGLRKAIGARGGDVLAQFLAEAVLLTVAGGLLGIVLGILLSWAGITIISHIQSGWSFSIPWDAVALGFGVSAIIGVTFGYFPARRAAKQNPIEALRFE